jgi:hypothetical protein
MAPTKKNRISEITRRDIVDRLLIDDGDPFHGRMDLVPFLRRIWPLSQMPSTDYRYKDAEGDIWQHMVNNNDWSVDDLLYRRLKIDTIPDEQFARFLEIRMHPLACPDPERLQVLLGWFNDLLKNDHFEMRQSGEISGKPLYKMVSIEGQNALGQAYEIVLSFAGEERDFVSKVANVLIDNDVSFFYDEFEEANLWGKNLVEYLHKVYGGSARYCVMFISKHYADKVWPTHERRSAFEKAIRSREEYILPARFDDTEIPGLHKDVHYIDLRKKTSDELAALILKKLGRSDSDTEDLSEADDDVPL